MKKYVTLFFMVLGCVLGTNCIRGTAKLNLVHVRTVEDKKIRSTPLTEKDLQKLKRTRKPGAQFAKILLDRVYGANAWKRAAGLVTT